jgi:hypothetical protein
MQEPNRVAEYIKTSCKKLVVAKRSSLFLHILSDKERGSLLWTQCDRVIKRFSWSFILQQDKLDILSLVSILRTENFYICE